MDPSAGLDPLWPPIQWWHSARFRAFAQFSDCLGGECGSNSHYDELWAERVALVRKAIGWSCKQPASYRAIRPSWPKMAAGTLLSDAT
jgi:hypothetical protein